MGPGPILPRVNTVHLAPGVGPVSLETHSAGDALADARLANLPETLR